MEPIRQQCRVLPWQQNVWSATLLHMRTFPETLFNQSKTAEQYQNPTKGLTSSMIQPHTAEISISRSRKTYTEVHRYADLAVRRDWFPNFSLGLEILEVPFFVKPPLWRPHPNKFFEGGLRVALPLWAVCGTAGWAA